MYSSVVFTDLYNQYHYLILENVRHSQRNPVPTSSHPPPPASTGRLLVSMDRPVLETLLNEIIQHVVFYAWLIAFSIVSSSFFFFFFTFQHFIGACEQSKRTNKNKKEKEVICNKRLKIQNCHHLQMMSLATKNIQDNHMTDYQNGNFKRIQRLPYNNQ